VELKQHLPTQLWRLCCNHSIQSPPSSTGDQRRARRIAARRHGFRNIQFPCGRRQDPHRLPLINHTSLWLGAWTPTLRIRTARSAACRCNCDAQLQSTIWVLSFPASTADGAVSSSTFHRALRFWNSPRQPLCPAKPGPAQATLFRGSKTLNTDNSAAANAAPAAARIACSCNRSCPSLWQSPCTARS